MKNRFLSLISVLSLILIPSFALAAWSEPAGSPPVCPSGQSGCDVPINIGPSAQTKQGALTISTLGSGAGGMGLMVGSNTLVLQAAQNLIYGNIDSTSAAGSNLLLLQNEDITKFVVTKDGNVGIGTPVPGEKLDVNGNVNITGKINLGYERISNIAGGGWMTANCSAGKVAIGGGCNCVGTTIVESYPVSNIQWGCLCSSPSVPSQGAYVICARIE